MKYDIVIVGKGPAGCSAALYAKRAGKNVLVIANSDGALLRAEKIQNYYGAYDAPSGKELIARGDLQLKELDVPVMSEQVVAIHWMGDYFDVVTQPNRRIYQALTVILATGAERRGVAIEGLSAYEGKGVSYCATCDAFFYRGKTVGVIGSGEFAAHELDALASLAAKNYVFTQGEPIGAAFPAQTTVITQPIATVNGDGTRLNAVTLSGGETIALDGLFVAIGQAQAGTLARTMGAELNGTSIAVNDGKMTNIPGLYAAGDCIGGLLQVSKAVSDGAIAAISAIQFVKKRGSV